MWTWRLPVIIVLLSGCGVAAADDLDQRAIRLVLRAHLDEVVRCNERGRPGDDLCTRVRVSA